MTKSCTFRVKQFVQYLPFKLKEKSRCFNEKAFVKGVLDAFLGKKPGKI